MLKTVASAMFVLGMTFAAYGQSTEEIISFQVEGANVVGTLSVPEGEPAPVVLLFHGFGGSRNEMEVPSIAKGLYTYTADQLAAAGYASLRIDFRGSGQSDGEFEDTTYSGQIADGLAAVAFLQSDSRVDGTHIAIIGWSQGGLVASAVAGRSGIPVATAIWNGLGDPEATFTALLGPERIAAGLKTGDTPTEMPMPWGFSLYTKQPYFEEILSMKPFVEIAAYKGALFVAEGTEDEVIPAGTGDKFIAAHEGPEELFVRPMNHGFNVFVDMTTFDEMLGATMAFFKPYLDN